MESHCSEDSPECICPCGCGCQNDPNGQDLPFNDKGQCLSCSEGRHEITPLVAISDLIEMHESIINHLSRFAVENKIKDGQDKYGRRITMAKPPLIPIIIPDRELLPSSFWQKVRCLFGMHKHAYWEDGKCLFCGDETYE
jgi:hypothetical protein